MSFIEGLACFANANCILVIVDKCTRYAHVIPPFYKYYKLCGYDFHES
jgi:hypothetical protein